MMYCFFAGDAFDKQF